MTQCWNCGTEMIWDRELSFEEYGIDGEGIITVFTCPNCNALAFFYTSLDEEEE